MNDPNPYESPKAATTTREGDVQSSDVGDKDQPVLGPISSWALVGSGCGVTAAVLSVVIAFSRGSWEDERDGQQVTILLILSVILLLPVGAVIGAIVGLFVRHRRRRDEPRIATTQSPPP